MHACLLKKLAGCRASTGIRRSDALEGLPEFLQLFIAHVGDSSLMHRIPGLAQDLAGHPRRECNAVARGSGA